MSRLATACARRCRQCEQQLGVLHLVIALNLAAVQTVVGIASGSRALAVCAIFSVRACILSAIVVVSVTSARRPGRGRAAVRGKTELLIAAGMSLSSLVGVAVLCYVLLHSLLAHPLEPPSWGAAWTALASAAVCWVMANQAGCVARRGNRAVAAHVELCHSHACVALAVVATVAVTRLGFAALDSIAAVVLAAGAIWQAGRVLTRSIAGLMDAAVGGRTHDAMRAALAGVEGLPREASVAGFRIGRDISARVTVSIADATSMREVGRLRHRIDAALRQRVPDVCEVLVGFCPAGAGIVVDPPPGRVTVGAGERARDGLR